ncbi:MAG: beta-lactamase family protein [Pirellulales bacterium]|nr:beta-lactamase family protein [Pirellulales bacterium]
MFVTSVRVRWFYVGAFVLTCCLGAGAAQAEDALPAAPPSEVGLSEEKLAAIDEAMQSYVDKQKLAGIVVLIAREGKVAHAGVYGKLDREADKPMTRDALFRIYSMSKPITSAALMTLYDEGRFQLDDPVSKYLPELGDLKVYAGKKEGAVQLAALERPITIRDLMRHTSGLAYGIFPASPVDALYRDAKVLDRDQTLDEMLEKLSKLPLAAQPGDKWMYSISVDVQGKLIEKLSGKPLDEYLQERIFTPLKMTDTAFYVPSEKLARMTVNYGPGGETKLKPIDPAATSQFATKPAFLSGGGGLVSTADDYLRFCQMMLNGGELDGARILKPETVAMMTENQLPDELVPIALGPLPMPNMGFGLGFSVRVAQGKNEPAGSVGAYGWGGAASTQFFIAPRENLVCVAMTQFMPATQLYVQELQKLVFQSLLEPVAAP